MWKILFLFMIGASSGILISAAILGLIIELSIIPRYAGITHTAQYVLLYENCICAGILSGNIVWIFSIPLPFTRFFLFLFGICSGFFLGGWILALSEIANMLPIVARRIRLTEGFSYVILSIALGKTLGSILFYYLRW